MTRDRLDELRDLATLRKDRSAARLAKYQGLIDGLEEKVRALRDARPPAPESVAEAAARDRWSRWRGQQLMVLNQQIAQLNALAQPHREAHARDHAREIVVDTLRKRRG
ncbi:hypothetical protein MWU52_11885 [Jannaschia sp. S6380]|uniref:hypothetical protein n=1 Tax=Jannaschia sp. S6380 TaxID=2926408 RepID=UPI001FF296E6|nr:hypothetical protein [Jannaschia sp. S6380]MCK0168256.1 hypothetical protein [Jannaschia sp. S6380]